MTDIIILIALITMAIGLVFLQVYLSKQKHKCFGLMIPLIFILLSIFAIFVSPVTQFTEEMTVTESTNDGEIIVEHTVTPANTEASVSSIIVFVIMLFCLYNIPTLISLVIYGIVRSKMHPHHEIDKMNIQDLN
ncbi:MAG: hypothetical protein JXR88_06020 [Clostridia bacterium]|nr:hypothetical protein [Clostridia bacterium]